jgi:hypothetical protein
MNKTGSSNGATLVLALAHQTFWFGGTMTRHATVVAIIAMAISSSGARGEDASAICLKMFENASRDIDASENSSEYLSTVFDNYCDRSGTIKTGGFQFGVSLPIPNLPLELTLGSQNNETAIKNFCRNYAATAGSRVRTRTYTSHVVGRALDNMVECMRISRTGSFIRHEILNEKAANVELTPAAGNPFKLRGVKVTGRIRCTGNTGNDVTTEFTQKTRFETTEVMVLTCERGPEPAGGETKRVYEEGTVTIATATIPYSFLWPRTVKLPIDDAAAIRSNIDNLQQNIAQVNKSIETARQRSRKFCQANWLGHFRDLITVPDSFTIGDCKELMALDHNLSDVAAQWFVGCLNVTPPKIQRGANGGGRPADNSCGW